MADTTTTDLLQRHFDLALEAPDGIKKLRELILTLAMQGKLVPQDPNDQPASELLKEIENKKRQVVSEGMTRAASKVPNPSTLKAPVELPAGWEWARLTDLGYFLGGKTPSTNKPEYWGGKIPWVSAKDMKTRFIVDSEDHVTNKGKESGLPTIPEGSVLMVVRSGILRRKFPTAITKVECTINQDLKAWVPYLETITEFILAMLEGFERFILSELSKKGVTVESLVFEDFVSTKFPLPPLQEQRRIVAKIDQLMAVCDELEKRRDSRIQKRLAVHNSAIRRLLDAEETSEFSSAWDFLVEHFGEIYSVKENVAELRRAILQLAVMGKLVKQDLKNETVTSNFSGIEKLNGVQSHRIPSNWLAFLYGDLTSLVTSGSRGWKEFYSEEGSVFLRTQNIKTDKVVMEDIAFVKLPVKAEGARTRVEVWDILITITGANVTKAALVETKIEEAYVSQHIALTRPRWSEMAPWLHLCFLSPGAARGQLEQLAYGDKPGLNLDNIRNLPIPVPPLPEQHRIVAKVDQLMALCESLESQIARATDKKTRVLGAVLSLV